MSSMSRQMSMTERLGQLESSLAQHCRFLGVRFAMDRPGEVTAFPSQWVTQLVEGLSLYALSTLDTPGELLITAVPTPHGLELEIAVTPEAIGAPSLLESLANGMATGSITELRRCQQLAFAIGAEITVQACPEGGTAFTVVLRAPERPRLAA